jgi:tight adherence protein B
MNSNLINISIIIVLVGSGFGLMLLGSLSIVFSPRLENDRVKTFVEGGIGEKRHKVELQSNIISKLRGQLNKLFSVFSSKNLQKKISSAYWQMTDTEFIFMRLAGSFIGFLIGWMIPQNILGGIGMALVIYMLPDFFLTRSIMQRRKVFQDQLIDVLVLIRGSVQSGFSLLQSLEIVIKEMAPPASEEFNRVVREVQLGLPLSRALLNLSGRMESDDLRLVVTSIIINSEVGGNLSTMLTAVTNTIRNRIYLFSEIRSSSSYARYTSYFLTFLPIVTALIIFLVNPNYFLGAWDSPITKILFSLSGVGMVIGNILLRKISQVNV